MRKSAFWRGDYLGAVETGKFTLDAGSRAPVLVMMLSPAYFAAGNYREAAATAQTAMHAARRISGNHRVHRRELYGVKKHSPAGGFKLR